MTKFQEFKMGKRLKVSNNDDKINAYQVTEQDIELMTELEREAANGRYLLEKRSRFQLQNMSKIVSCCVSHTHGRKSNQSGANSGKVILVIGQSNGVFSLYDLDSL